MSRAMESMAVVKRLEAKGNPSTRRESIDINASPESDSPLWKLASEQRLPKDKLHYLLQVKRQRMKRVLSFRDFCEEMNAASSGDAEVMELFPRRTGYATIKPINTGSCLPPAPHHRHDVAGKSADHQPQGRLLLKPSGVRGAGCASPATTPHKQPSTQLTIFYNGTVNVYNVYADQAQAIMDMLAGDGNSRQPDPETNFGERRACTTVPGSSNGPLIWKAGGQSEVPTALAMPKQTPTAESRKKIVNFRRAELPLPLARKQSLQRFLQRRQIRLNNVAPYTTSAASPNKAVTDKMEPH